MLHHLRTLLGGLAALALLAGCGGGALSASDGRVRLANLSGEIGTLDLYEGSDRLQSGVMPFSTSGYEKLDDGSYNFSIRGGVAGASIASLTASVEKDGHLTLVAYSSGGTPTLAAVTEDEDEPDKGVSKLRFFNAATDAGSVDVYLTRATACSGNLATEVAIATAVSGLQSGYIDINPSGSTGAYRLCATAAGSRTDVRLDSELTVGDRAVITVVLARTTGGVLLNGAALVQDGDATPLANSAARVRLAVGVVGAVSASFGATSLGSASSPGVGTYQLVSAASSSTVLSVMVNGVAVTPSSAISVSPGSDYTLLVSGNDAATAAVTLIADDNTRSTDAANPVRIRLVHGASNANVASLDVGSVSIDNVVRGSASSYINTEASVSTAGTTITVTAGGTILCTGSDPLSATATVYSVFALGNLPISSPAGKCLLRADR